MIRDRIRLLAEIDREHQVFGASTHQYQLAPTLDEPAVRAIEARLGVTLPDDYRSYLCSVGASGAGPYYGLLPTQAPEDADPTRDFPFAADAEIHTSTLGRSRVMARTSAFP
jgi:hypothetical protein